MTHIVYPHCNVGQDLTILREVKVPEGLLILLDSVLGLERLVTRILFQVVKQPQHIGQPQHCGIEVLMPFLDDPLDSIDDVVQQRAHLFIVVNVVRVADTHEENVGGQSRQQGHCYSWFQFCR